MPPENKDAAVFSVRFNGKWALLHRPVSGMEDARQISGYPFPRI